MEWNGSDKAGAVTAFESRLFHQFLRSFFVKTVKDFGVLSSRELLYQQVSTTCAHDHHFFLSFFLSFWLSCLILL